MGVSCLRLLAAVPAIILVGVLSTQDCFADDTKKKEGAEVKAPLFGQLLDRDGNPVTDAKLTLQGPSYYRSSTDDKGHYEFLDASDPGQYRLRIESKGWVGFTNYRKLPIITVDSDKPTEKNFTLAKACKIKLTVVDENGQPVTATINYRSTIKDLFSNSERAGANREGIAVIGGLKPSKSKYVIGVSSKSHAPAQLTVLADDANVIVERKVVLKDGKTVKGTVMCSDGKPPAGWHIYALPNSWDFGSYPRGSEIGEDGSFELKHVGDGPYGVHVSIPLGDRMSTSRSVLADVELAKMEQPISAKLNYPSPSSMNYLTCNIRWIGKPSNKGFSIDGYCANLSHHTRHYVKDGEKTVKIGPLPAGTYRIRPQSSSIEVMNLRQIKNLDSLDKVKIPSEKPLQIVLRAVGKPHVQGKVVDAKTKQPIKSFQFRVAKHQTLSGPNYVQPDEWKIAKSPTGKFESEVVGPGIYSVQILADGFASKTTELVNTVESPDKELTLELETGVSVTGRVVDDEGKPVEGATVRARTLASGAMPRVTTRFVTSQGQVETDKNGEFSFPNLAVGHEAFRVEHPDFVFRETQLFPIKEKTVPIAIALSKGATIQGRVFDVDGKPLVDEPLLFYDDYAYGGGDRDAGKFGETTTDDKGFYKVERIPEAQVYVSRSDTWKSLGMARHSVFTRDGQTHTLNFGGTSKLTGKYITNGQPLAGNRLQLAGHDSTFGAMKMYCRTSDDGSFMIHGPPPGHWTLYREISGRSAEWVKVQSFDVPRTGDVDLGTIEHKVGTLTVQLKTNADALPDNLTIDLVQYNRQHMFGRTAAALLPHEDNADPYVFNDVSPGDFELTVRGARMNIRRRLKLTNKEIDTTIVQQLPVGTATARINAKDKDGKPIATSFMIWSEDKVMHTNSAQKTTDDEIPFCEVNDLANGKYTVCDGRGRNPRVVGKFEIVDGKDVTMDVQLTDPDTATVPFEIFVTDPQGVFTPCQIEFEGEGTDSLLQYFATVSTRVQSVAGEYTMKINHPGYQPIRKKIEAVYAGEIRVTLEPEN